MKSIIAAATEKARVKVAENEKLRESEERKRIFTAVKQAEDIKQWYLIRAGGAFVVSVVVISSTVRQIEYLVIALGTLLILLGMLVYRVYRITRVSPYVKSAHITLAEMQQLTNDMVAEAMELLRREEDVYNERMRRENEERIVLRRKRKAEKAAD
jgi:hypothetical protein